MKITATLSAKKLLNDLKKTHGKDLLFHQSGGCCDGSAPMCFPAKEYQVGNSDIKNLCIANTKYRDNCYNIGNSDIKNACLGMTMSKDFCYSSNGRYKLLCAGIAITTDNCYSIK